jgi:hypothetical protein
MTPPRIPETGRKRARWRKDLRFFFSGGIAERASLFFTEETPILLITVFKDVVTFLPRLGFVTESDLRRIENLPSPPGGYIQRSSQGLARRMEWARNTFGGEAKEDS